MLSIQGVRKQYEGHLAVDDVNIEIPRGIIFGLLGPNGAGKTTLIRMITGITKPDRGRIQLNGETISGVLHTNIGYLPEERGLYQKMKVAEHLVYLARLKGLDKADAYKRTKYWLEKFDMMDWRKRKIEELSKGMQQKIQFIATVIHEPDLIILDEPFTGLDPVNTNLIKDEIRTMRNDGKSIIFSTHRMEQVEEICESIALINQGKNVLTGSVTEIKEDFKLHQYSATFKGDVPTFSKGPIQVISAEGNILIFSVPETNETSEALKYLVSQPVEILKFEELLPSLNEVFIKAVAQ
jgi:ABC-2 type transport system ATP-binding protein